VFSRNGAVMTETLETVTTKMPLVADSWGGCAVYPDVRRRATKTALFRAEMRERKQEVGISACRILPEYSEPRLQAVAVTRTLDDMPGAFDAPSDAGDDPESFVEERARVPDAWNGGWLLEPAWVVQQRLAADEAALYEDLTELMAPKVKQGQACRRACAD
jgi:hypothetical protein